MLLCVTAFSMEGFSQKGMNSVGIDIPVGYGKKNVWTGLGIKYQYNITNFIRVEPTFSFFPIYSTNYFHVDQERSDSQLRVQWQAFANCHFFVQSPKTVRPFFIIGAGMTHWASELTYQYDSSTITNQYDSFAFDGGLGLDVRLTYNWSMQFKALAILPIRNDNVLFRYRKVLVNGSIGLAYNF